MICGVLDNNMSAESMTSRIFKNGNKKVNFPFNKASTLTLKINPLRCVNFATF